MSSRKVYYDHLRYDFMWDNFVRVDHPDLGIRIMDIADSGASCAMKIGKESNSEEELIVKRNIACHEYIESLGDVVPSDEARQLLKIFFIKIFDWQLQKGNKILEPRHKDQDSLPQVIHDAVPERQWDKGPGNGPHPGFHGTYKFFFDENDTDIRFGDLVHLKNAQMSETEQNFEFFVIEIAENYIVVDTQWVVLSRGDSWDIELVYDN